MLKESHILDVKQEERKENLIDYLASGNEKKEKILKEYWNFINESEKETEEKVLNKTINKEDIKNNLDDAEEYIKELIANKIFPIISVPRKFLSEIKEQGGIKANSTYIPEVKLITGVLGREPFAYKDNRVLFEIHCESKDIKPRATGKYNNYDGVVCWNKDFIPMDKMQEVNL